MQEIAFGLLKMRPVLTRYRLTSSQKSVVYDSSKIMRKAGWKPAIHLAAALDRLVTSELAKRNVTPPARPEAGVVDRIDAPRVPVNSGSTQ